MLTTNLFLGAGLLLLIAGAEVLVRGVSGLAAKAGISPFSFVMGAFVIPISVVTLAVLGVRALQAEGK